MPRSYFLLSVLIIGLSHSVALGQYYLYHDSQDTIRLTQISDQPFCYCSIVEVVDSVQIDGKGSKEVILHRRCTLTIRDHGGMFDFVEDGLISKYEIWDLDSKICLFEAVHDYQLEFSRSHGYGEARWPEVGKGRESYTYDFEIDSLGTIVISNFRSMLEKYGEENIVAPMDSVTQASGNHVLPGDNVEGTYVFDRNRQEYVRE